MRSIILTGAGKAFSGGADIKEFGSPKAVMAPNLLSVILAIEHSPKPVVAAAHSVAIAGLGPLMKGAGVVTRPLPTLPPIGSA